MIEFTLSPTSTSIHSTISGFEDDHINNRVIQYYLNEITDTPIHEILVGHGNVNPTYSYTFVGLETNKEYEIIVRVIDDETSDILNEFIEKAVCGGSDKSPTFSIKDVTSNTANVELYRGIPSYSYYRLYVFDAVNEESIFTDWLRPDQYPMQLTGLNSGTLYRINVGYGNIYGGGVAWIGTQTFTTSTDIDLGHMDEGKFTMPDASIQRNSLGSRAGNLKTSSFNNTYTRVTITTKDEESSSDIAYSVGNDDGLEMEVSCPWIGADEYQAVKIASYILSAINTYIYKPYNANEALLDPAAELGDLISFDNVTSEIINFDLHYDSMFNADISAPTSNEAEHEFPQGATSKDSTKRYVDGMRAALEVELDKITAMVENNQGRFQKLQVTLDGVIIQNENGQTIINGANIQTGSIVFNQIAGMTEWKSSVDTNLEENDERMDGIDDDIRDLSREIGSISEYSWSKVYRDLIANGGMTSSGGVTTINSATIYSPEIYAGQITTSNPVGGIMLTSNGLAFTLNRYDGSGDVDSSNLVSLTIEDGTTGSTTYKLPTVLLGQGTGTATNPAGTLKKYTNGIWVGEWFNDNHGLFDPLNTGDNTGLFINFANDSLVLDSKMYGGTLPPKSTAMKGQIFFKI